MIQPAFMIGGFEEPIDTVVRCGVFSRMDKITHVLQPISQNFELDTLLSLGLFFL
jgi:hypothetical protein